MRYFAPFVNGFSKNFPLFLDIVPDPPETLSNSHFRKRSGVLPEPDTQPSASRKAEHRTQGRYLRLIRFRLGLRWPYSDME